MSLFKTPFSKEYWKESLKSFRSLRGMVFAALMVALCIVLAQMTVIKVSKDISISFTYVARALCSLVYGPIGALVFSVVEDTLSFLLHPSGPYFPGYLLTTMLGCFTYAIFFYRSKITITRIVCAKTLIQIQNIFLGTLWRSMLGGKAFILLFPARAIKNLIQLPVDIIILIILFQAILPILRKMNVIPNQLGPGNRITLF